MAKQTLVISPKKVIVFRGPYDRACFSLVVLQNPMDMPVAWRCRTLQPEMYVVKPSSGVIRSKQSITVQIKLMKIHALSTNSFNLRQQKFLIQSVMVPPNLTEIEDPKSLFTPDAMIATSKMRAVFENLDNYRWPLKSEQSADDFNLSITLQGNNSTSMSKSVSLPPSHQKNFQSVRSTSEKNNTIENCPTYKPSRSEITQTERLISKHTSKVTVDTTEKSARMNKKKMKPGKNENNIKKSHCCCC